MSTTIYLLAGEVSGDTHGAELMHALQQELGEVSFLGAGGPEMRKIAGEGMRDWVEDAAVMGVWEVLKHYKWFKQQFAEMLEEVKTAKPDALILIDYPGFNLRMAKAVREALPKTKIIYYISPQVWAWNKGRIPKMAQLLDKMLCILPFEKKLFEDSGLPTEFVGHPLVDELAEKKIDCEREAGLVGLFPGSREREVARLFPMMVESARRMADHNSEIRFEAPAASSVLAERMREIISQSGLEDGELIKVTEGGSHSLMQRAACGVIASGTATLEAAWYGLPYCLVYRIAWPTYFLGKMLVKIDYIGLINILAGDEVVEEFIQSDADPCHVQQALEQFLKDPEHAAKVGARVKEVASGLGDPGCHGRAAREVVATLKG